MDIFWLLFVTLGIPFACFCICAAQVMRGAWFGYCNRRARRAFDRRYVR